MKIPKGQFMIKTILKNPHKNYYIGHGDFTENKHNKCKLEFGVKNIDNYKFKNVLFDIIVLEFCPINLHLVNDIFFTEKFFTDICKILKPLGTIVIPLDDLDNEYILDCFSRNNFRYTKKYIKSWVVYFFRRK